VTAAPAWDSPEQLRPITPADLPSCADVFYTSLNDYVARSGQPILPRNEAAMVSFFGHLLETDPERAWLCEGRDGVEGFALAHLRGGSFWFLSFLFVLPAAQSRGVGRRLLLRCFPHDPRKGAGDGVGGSSAWPGVLGTCIDSIQPVSTALYARYGLVPRVPLFTLVGRPRARVLPALPPHVERVAFEQLVDGPEAHRLLAERLAEIDRQILGYDRATDHRAWRLADRRGTLYRERATGRVLGYGYAQPSGRLGPVALLDRKMIPAVLGDLMGSLEPLGDWQVFVPGVAQRSLVALLDAGFRLEGPPAIHCSSRTVGPDLTRYLPLSFALL
jgi:GNAT superfamily N-acetyltransferase